MPAWLIPLLLAIMGYPVAKMGLDIGAEKIFGIEPPDIRQTKLAGKLQARESSKKRAAETQFRKEEGQKEMVRQLAAIRGETAQGMMGLKAAEGQQQQAVARSGISPVSMGDVPVGIQDFLGM